MPERHKKREAPPVFVAALMRNPVRAEIVTLVTERPGLNRHQLAKALDVHPTTIDFHVQRLEAAGLVATRPSPTGRETLCFTPDNVGLWEKPATRILFGHGSPRDLAAFVAAHPGSDAQRAAEALGLSVYTVRRHVRLLEAYDLVQRMRVDRSVLYHARPRLVAWLAHVVPGELGARSGRHR